MVNQGKCTKLLILLILLMTLVPENDAWWRRRRRRRSPPPPPPPPPPDTTDPTFTYCPGNLGNKYTTGTSRSVSWGTPTATDNSGSVTVSRVSGQSSGSSFFVSSNQYTIQYRASDSAGNSANCYITFMVIGVRCSTLSAPSHGSVGCTNTNFISSVCTISCDLGYYVVGSKIRTCIQSGNTGYWDGSTTTCSRIRCSSLSAPENGKLSCTDNWYFGSSCTFSCNSGYSLITSQPTLTCLQNEMWSSSGGNMQCLDVQAPTFTGCPVSQTVTAAPLEISAVVTWNTPSSSDNSGESIPVIQEQGPLSGSALQEGDHMVMFTATDSSGNKVSCTFTITVRVVYCPAISVDLPLQVNCSDGYVRGYVRGSECTFSCSTGYILDGQETSRCLLTGSDGAWDTATPTCQITQCEEPPLLENGGLKGECSRNFGSTCYFECDVGYEINNDVLTCLAQPDSSYVSWHGEVPECSRIYCTKPPFSIGLQINVSSECPSGSQVPSGNHCHFFCTVGYYLQGNDDLMCQEDRTWSGTFPTCSLITCAVADVPVPMNAIIQEACKVEHVNYGTVCTISCQEGYEATGPSMSTDMTCSDDGDDVGSWSGDSIQCSEVTCLAPIPEESGFTPFTVECFYNDEQTTISDRQRISTSCSFECVDGYSLVEGSSARICLPTGEWSGNAVSCKDITPPELTCPVDAVLIAGKGTTSADIPWSLWEPILAIDLGTTIEATLLSINHIDVEENRTSSFSEGIHTLVYQARDSSENEADCSFSVTVTVCRCPPLQIPEDSIVTLQSGVGSCSTGVVYGSVCTISCEIGYELSTGDVSLSRTCDITESDQSCDATWSGVDPVCEIVRCNTPSITNGFLDCSPSTQHSVAYLTSCEFSCNTGYRTPTGEENRMRTCQANTTWSGEDFQCTEIVTCPARLGIPYGSVAPSPCESSDSVPFHSTCTFTCEAGFRLDGPISVECSPNGQWAPSGDSVCVDIQPPTFNLECPHKIEVDAPPNQVTAVVHFEEPIPQDNSGIVNLTRLDPSLTSGSTFPEGTTTIRYEATDGFALTSFCSIIIEVTVHRCSTLHPTLHGSMIGCDDPYIGSECSFSCDGGYDLEGASSLQCELSSDGIPAWNKDMPTCQIQTCRPLQVPEFASAPGCDDSFVTFGTTCTFSCEPGYTGKGASTLTCLEGGVWPSTDFECERISCEVLSEPTSISISPEICLSDPRFGDICTLECEQSGFKITPPNLKELTCNGDQTWSGNTEEAQCVDLQAPEFEDCPQDMVVFVNRGEDSAYVEWSVLVRDNDPQSLELVGMCNQQPGIMNIGEYVISCSAVDEAGNEGFCQFTLEVKARECETLSPPEHGYLLDECKMIHGCACHLECSEGYILEGSSSATCEFDGSDTYWHYEDTPVCRTTSCTPLVVHDEVILSPSTCSGSDMVPDGTVCTMSCDFLLTLDTDLRSFTCREGEWDQELDISVIPCKDEVPPTIRDCPQSPLRVDRIKLWGVEVTFFNPTAIDNFDTELLITTDPLDLKSPYNFTSDTKCRYTFTDEAGNSVSCVFIVDITNKVQPVITSCPLGGEVIATEGTVEVKYEHPSYSPIPGIDLVVSCDVPDSPVTLPVGHHEITCYVSDPETALQSECKMDFDVTYVSRCPHLYPPENGALACDIFAYGQFCSMLCEKGYDIPRKGPRTEMFICSTSGDWSPRSDVPGCSERKPRSVSRNILPETLYYPSPCSENEDTSVNTIAQGFLDILKASEFGYICEDNDQCSVENVNVSCGIRSDRRRRHISDNGPFARISPLDNMMAEKKGGDTPVDTMHKKDNPKTTILSSDAGCDEGHFFDKVDLKCVPCPAGYYFDKATKICNPCDLGFYQDRQAQNECKLCREDTSTIEKGATDAKQCKEFCPAGHFSKSGFFPCRRCPPGFYQRRPQSTSCRRCPVNTTTTISGATSVKSCHILN